MTAAIQGDTDAVAPGLYLQYRGRSLAGWVDPAARAAFAGYVLGQPDFGYSRYSSELQLQFGTLDNLLSGGSLQDVSFAVAASPANSHEATSWRFSTIIEHILRAHTNFVFDADGSDGSPEGPLTTLDFDSNSTLFNANGDFYIINTSTDLWGTLQNIGGGEEGGGEFYRLWFTRRNALRYQPAPPFINPTPTSRGTLTKNHLRGTIQVKYNNTAPGQRVGQVQIVAGIRPSTIFSSQYPASPGVGKIVQKKSGVWSQSQGRTDTLAQRLYRWLTRTYTLTVQVDAGLALFGADGRGLELGDRVAVTYNGPAEDSDTGAGVHLNLSSQSFYIYQIDINFDNERHMARASLVLEHDNA
jgi:hypothetical protein